MVRQLRIVVFGLSALFLLSACGPPLATVKGTVSYKSKPLTHGEVFLRGSDGATVRANIAGDGTYEAKGVKYGEVLVSVRQLPKDYQTPAEVRKAFKEKGMDVPQDYDYSPPKTPWAAKYADLEKSGLKATVSRGTIPFDISLLDEE